MVEKILLQNYYIKLQNTTQNSNNWSFYNFQPANCLISYWGWCTVQEVLYCWESLQFEQIFN